MQTVSPRLSKCCLKLVISKWMYPNSTQLDCNNESKCNKLNDGSMYACIYLSICVWVCVALEWAPRTRSKSCSSPGWVEQLAKGFVTVCWTSNKHSHLDLLHPEHYHMPAQGWEQGCTTIIETENASSILREATWEGLWVSITRGLILYWERVIFPGR